MRKRRWCCRQTGDGVQAGRSFGLRVGLPAGLLRSANSANQAASLQSSQLTTISDALTNNGDVQSAIDQFFQDVGTLAANPTSAAQRQRFWPTLKRWWDVSECCGCYR